VCFLIQSFFLCLIEKCLRSNENQQSTTGVGVVIPPAPIFAFRGVSVFYFCYFLFPFLNHLYLLIKIDEVFLLLIQLFY